MKSSLINNRDNQRRVYFRCKWKANVTNVFHISWPKHQTMGGRTPAQIKPFKQHWGKPFIQVSYIFLRQHESWGLLFSLLHKVILSMYLLYIAPFTCICTLCSPVYYYVLHHHHKEAIIISNIYTLYTEMTIKNLLDFWLDSWHISVKIWNMSNYLKRAVILYFLFVDLSWDSVFLFIIKFSTDSG